VQLHRVRPWWYYALRSFDVTQYQESKIRGSCRRKASQYLEILVSDKAERERTTVSDLLKTRLSARRSRRLDARSFLAISSRRGAARCACGKGEYLPAAWPLTRPLRGPARERDRDGREGRVGWKGGSGRERERDSVIRSKAKRAPADFWDPAKNAWARSPRGLAEAVEGRTLFRAVRAPGPSVQPRGS